MGQGRGHGIQQYVSCRFPMVSLVDPGKSRPENDPGIHCALVSLVFPFFNCKRVKKNQLHSFDEFQLIDASSAALIRDVLSWYWRLGGVIVTCSNRVPEDLYHHGVQKERLAGFLDALKARCEVVQVDGGRDWRREIERGDQIRWFHSKQQLDFERAWSAVLETQECSSNTV